MKIIIVEDEKPIADYIERLCFKILSNEKPIIQKFYTLEKAETYLFDNTIDLCLLDLNLNGKNGYELLQMAVSGSFHTIIISANTDKAIEAFKYGVLDFIPKPFDEDMLVQAFNRYFDRLEKKDIFTKYLSTRKNGSNTIIKIDDIEFFKAADIYVDAHLKNGRIEILNKTMDRLEQLLPQNFMRVHRSFLVDVTQIKSYGHCGGGNYQVITKTGNDIPLSRQKYKELHEVLN